MDSLSEVRPELGHDHTDVSRTSSVLAILWRTREGLLYGAGKLGSENTFRALHSLITIFDTPAAVVDDNVALFAELVEALEMERSASLNSYLEYVNFLYQRLNEAKETISTLRATVSLNEEWNSSPTHIRTNMTEPASNSVSMATQTYPDFAMPPSTGFEWPSSYCSVSTQTHSEFAVPHVSYVEQPSNFRRQPNDLESVAPNIQHDLTGSESERILYAGLGLPPDVYFSPLSSPPLGNPDASRPPSPTRDSSSQKRHHGQDDPSDIPPLEVISQAEPDSDQFNSLREKNANDQLDTPFSETESSDSYSPRPRKRKRAAVSIAESHLSRKSQRATPKDPVKFKHECDFCEKRFTRSTTLREHKRTHTNERPFSCSQCPMSFARNKDKNRHEELHGGEKQLICDVGWYGTEGQCGKRFVREDALIAHLRTERGWKCLRSTLDAPDFKHEAANKSKDGARFNCNLTELACGAEFNSFPDLLDHLRDFVNRSCVMEILLKDFLCWSRSRRDERRAARSQTEEHTHNPSSVTLDRSSSQHEADSRLPPGTSQPAQTTISEPSQTDMIPLGSRSTGTDTGPGNSEANSLDESTADIDPFAGWTLRFTECGKMAGPVWLSISISISCLAAPQEAYLVGIGQSIKIAKKSVICRFQDYYCCNLSLCLSEFYVVTKMRAHAIYISEISSGKTFRVGDLCWNSMKNHWTIAPNSPPKSLTSLQATQTLAEGQAATALELRLPDVSGGGGYSGAGSRIEEVTDTPAERGDARISEPKNASKFKDFSDWAIADSEFDPSKQKLQVALRYKNGRVPERLLPSLQEICFQITSIDTVVRQVQDARPIIISSCSCKNEIYTFSLDISASEWVWKEQVRIHLYFPAPEGVSRPRLFIGEKVVSLYGWKWNPASPGACCFCSLCVDDRSRQARFVSATLWEIR